MRLQAIIIFSLPLALLLSCQNREDGKAVDFDGSSQVSIINRTNDSLRVKLENWYAVPFEAQNLDTVLSPSGSLTYRLKAQGKNYYDLSIDDTQYKIFTQPNANDTIVLSNSSRTDSILFLGNAKAINEFLLKKALKFGSPDADWIPRAEATHGAESFHTVIRVNDSLTQEHIAFVKQQLNALPKWYADFEINRLKYLNVGFKINSFFYRKMMMGKAETLPPNFASEIKASVKVQNPAMLGNMQYQYFLNDYMAYRKDSSLSLPRPTSKEEWQHSYNTLLATAHQVLTGRVRDFYLASRISTIIDARSYVLDTNWIAQVEDQNMQDFLHHYMANHEVLPKGAPLPYFYLKGLEGQAYEPKDFQRRILLINFWATWCKPCIKEFPEENKLVEQFKADPVAIVNIAVDSDSGRWREMVKKHQLKTLNLLAQNKWNDVLSEKFGIQGLPHSVLIDWNGKIVQNKCARASEQVDEQIAALLDEVEVESY